MPAWIARTMAGGFYRFMENRASPRKRAQFIRFLCSTFADVITDPRSLAALNAADDYEAGNVDGPTYRAALGAAERVCAENRDARQQELMEVRQRLLEGQRPASTSATALGASLAAHVAFHVSADGYYSGVIPQLRDAAGFRDRPDLARSILPEMRKAFFELFGDPFRPVGLDPAWRTEAVVGLATGIYADRAFGRLPVLADALEDAGCADADVLTHCRGLSPHARGCWVVDLLLGKA